jgi:hypothetical protein
MLARPVHVCRKIVTSDRESIEVLQQRAFRHELTRDFPEARDELIDRNLGRLRRLHCLHSISANIHDDTSSY